MLDINSIQMIWHVTCDNVKQLARAFRGLGLETHTSGKRLTVKATRRQYMDGLLKAGVVPLVIYVERIDKD